MRQYTRQDLDVILKEGEGYLVEFKESVSDSLSREMVAFANSSGGRIFIGISDDKRLVGIQNINRVKSQVQDIARNCDPPVQLELDTVDNILIVHVNEGTDKPYSCKEGFFIRAGPNSQKMKRGEIVGLLKSEGLVRFEEQVCKNFQYPRDFSVDRFKNYLRLCKISPTIQREAALINLGVALKDERELIFTNAGVLLFAKDPRRFHLHAIITCGRFKGTDKVHIIDRKDFADDLISNVENAMKWLMTYIPVRYETKAGSLYRDEVPEIPHDALKEALLNSVIHRDYFERGAVTMVEFYDDRIEITNPGGLIGGMKIEDLGVKSQTRNPLIFDLIHRTGMIERMGSGIRRIRELVEAAGLRPPKFESTGFFGVCFERPAGPQNVIVSETVNEIVNETVILILKQMFRHTRLTAKVIEAATGYSRAQVMRYIAKMIKDSLIVYKGAPKTGSYKITDKGMSVLRAVDKEAK